MSEIDKLRQMLKEAKIPFESIIQKMPQNMYGHRPFASEYGAAVIYDRNQVIYGRYATNPEDDGFSHDWKFDAIWQYGSYGAKEGLIETYGLLGCDEQHNPRVMTAEEAFKIIKADWKETGGKADR